MSRLFWLLMKACGWLLVTALTSARGVAACYLYVLFNADYVSTAGRFIVLAVFTVASLSDSIDGPLARAFKVKSTLGAFLDPLCDKMLCWAVLYIIWQLCDTIPDARIMLAGPYIVIAGYDFSTLAFRILQAFGYLPRMKTSLIAKQRTIILQLVLGACLSFGVVQVWLVPGAQMAALMGLFFGGVYVMRYTYLSGREYLLTVRPWELFWSPSGSRA